MLNPLITTTMRLQFGELNITPRVVNRLHELDFTVPELEDAIADHKSPCDGEPSVYVGTYAKYNEGSLCGLWVDLSSFDDYDEFINFCKAIHADEEDPELMAQDYECFPRQWYNEGFMDEEDFDHIKEYTEMCDKHSVEAVDDYMELHDDLDDSEVIAKRLACQEPYCGEWDSEEDFARHIVEECYDLESTMGNLAQYFDYEAFFAKAKRQADDARELFMYDYSMGANNHVFRRI